MGGKKEPCLQSMMSVSCVVNTPSDLLFLFDKNITPKIKLLQKTNPECCNALLDYRDILERSLNSKE